MATLYIPTDVVVQGNLQVTGTQPTVARTDIEQTTLAEYMIPWTAWRVWDAYQTNLPGTSANDDLGLIGGTFGTNSPCIETYDVKAAGALNFYARACMPLPPEYQAGESVMIRVSAGMVTTVADNSCTIDFVVYESDSAAGIGADLCATAATNINGDLVLDTHYFNVTATTLTAADWLDIRMHVAVNDAGSGTEVKARIGYVALLCDIRG